MAEPTRKKNKNHGTVNVLLFPSNFDEASLVFLSAHKTRPCLVDLTEFHDGSTGPSGKGTNSWGGDFTGRPLLIKQLLPHFRAIYSSQTEGSIENAIHALRAYWRLFDECDTLYIRPNEVLNFC
jgi:hypothetical protein